MPPEMALTGKMLQALQDLPLEEKIKRTKQSIEAWHWGNKGKIFVSFSGGKDSTVLLHLVRSLYPDTPAVFCDTGLEYPEVRTFALNTPNTVVLKPELDFRRIIKEFGYPAISKKVAKSIEALNNPGNNPVELRTYRTGINGAGEKSPSYKVAEKWLNLFDHERLGHQPLFKLSDRCCSIMKKNPSKKFERESGLKPIIGTMAEDSRQRAVSYMRYGCNAFGAGRPISTPMGFWLEQDVLRFIKENKIEIASVYGDIINDGDKLKTTGCKRTGCVFCMFGVHCEESPNRFERLKETHPQLWDYCINKLGIGRLLHYIRVPFGEEKMIDKTKFVEEDAKVALEIALQKEEALIKEYQSKLETHEAAANQIKATLKTLSGKEIGFGSTSTAMKKTEEKSKQSKVQNTKPKVKSSTSRKSKTKRTIDDVLKVLTKEPMGVEELKAALGITARDAWRKLRVEMNNSNKINITGSRNHPLFALK